MSESLKFMMGQYKAIIPVDRMYCARHMWLQKTEGDTYRVGFTAYSVRLLQDVYFLEWSIDPGTPVKDRQDIGEVESSKAVSSMFTPCSGEIVEFNDELLNDPAGINADNYGSGWLYTMRTHADLLSPVEYVKVLEDGWEQTQRTIKGQMN
ncbi:MAG: glycine cleavage system protein H [Fuerstiella sp.]|nr:glycine cleavage system protein H [Fuerstiella sp.]MCP4782034.1 glycine cleavage system protein H [Fuerstiella sp.]MCP4853530.1 glycine cleavage system protein H [Fuerstiella sp.]